MTLLPGRRAGLPITEGDLDADLSRTVRRTALMRQLFYVVVLLVALAGQVSGAVEALGIPLAWAVPAVGALELGGIVVLANADVRRRLGERAIASRILSAAIAAFAVSFNWLAHSNKLLGGFFAGMSALGYLVWLMHTENQRRDRLRAKGDLPPTTPAYEVIGHWLRHPWLTVRAKNLAKAQPHLGLYDSIAEARAEVRRERRTSAISKVLHRKIRAAVDPTTADIAVAVYDLDEIAQRLAKGADYDGLTALIAADLAPARLAAGSGTDVGAITGADVDADLHRRPQLRAEATVGSPEPVAPVAAVAGAEPVNPVGQAAPPVEQLALPEATTDGPSVPRVLDPSIRDQITGLLPAGTGGRGRASVTSAASVTSPAASAASPASAPVDTMTVDDEPTLTPSRSAREGSLRSRVHAALFEHVPEGDARDTTTLTRLVGDLLDLSDVDRLTASNYVRSWKKEADAGRRAAVNGRHLQDVVPAKH